MRLTSRISPRTTAWALGLVAAATSIGCGGSGSVPTITTAPSYGQLGDQSSVAWSTPFGGRAVTPMSVAVASDGTTRIAATLSGDVTVGETALVTAGGTDVLLAELGADGQPLWARSYGDSKDQWASGVVVDADGGMIVTGTFAGTLDLRASAPVLEAISRTATSEAPGTAPMVAAGATDAFVAKLDHLGNLVWNTHLGGAGTTTGASSVALGRNGTIAITGAVRGSVELAAPGADEVFVAALDDAGRLQWMKTFEGAGVGTSIAQNPQGGLAVTGTYEGGLDVGAGPLPAFGGSDVFVAMLDMQGGVIWSQGLGGSSDDAAVGVAFDPSGNIVALANVSGAVQFGSPLRDRLVPGQETGRVVLAKYDVAGSLVGVNRFGSGGPLERGTALAVDAQGDAYIAGQLHRAFEFGTCTLAPTSPDQFRQAFVVLVSAKGQPTCGQRYGLGAEAAIRSLAVDPVRGVVMGGDFTGSIDLGQGTLAASPSGTFVAHEEPIPQPLL